MGSRLVTLVDRPHLCSVSTLAARAHQSLILLFASPGTVAFDTVCLLFATVVRGPVLPWKPGQREGCVPLILFIPPFQKP